MVFRPISALNIIEFLFLHFLKNGEMKIKFVLFILIILQVYILPGQSWNVISSEQIENKGIRDIIPEKYVIYSVDDEMLKSILWDSPKESSGNLKTSNKIIKVGIPDGSTEDFRIIEYDMMEPELAQAYPYIKTFYGISLIDNNKSIRIDYTLQGFRAVISSPDEGKIYIDHYQRNDKNTRIVYYRKYFNKIPDWECTFDEELHGEPRKIENIANRIGDCQLRTYRLAQATTGEYSNFHGASSSAQSGLVLSAVTTVINRVNQVYEADVAVRLILIANTAQIFYYDPATDPYTNNNGSTMLGENISNCNAVIGSANYDIGHVFSTGGGGVAYLGCVCGSSKAGGVTGSSNPVGDPFSIDYVAHEMGHQFNANHTFAGYLGSCSGNRNNSTAFEPGSGSTIMAYAGICSSHDIQTNSDAYFHAISLQEIKTFLNGSGGNCDLILSSFVNSAPTVTAQSNYTIPKSTPFVLTLNATDPENNPMTYAWEQMNGVSGNVTTPPVSTNTTGPMFRSLTPTVSPSRYFPPLSNVVNNTANTWEVLPSVSRTMNFRGTARDFTGVAGCNSEINLTVTTVDAAGPFAITSQNTATTWLEGETKTITWDVAGTTANGINTANVSILLSYDGGYTFPVTLLSSTPNDGSQEITVPEGTTSAARLMVKATDNIFFDINNSNITINSGFPTFELELIPSNLSLCSNESDDITINVNGILGYSQPVSLSVSNMPSGVTYSFSANPVLPGQNSILTLTNVNATAGISNIYVRGVSNTIEKNISFELNISDAPSSVILTSPADNSSDLSINPLLSWNAIANSDHFEIQISREIDFGSLILNTNSNTNSFQVSESLEGLSVFYWKVRAVNQCGTGNWSSIFSFQTQSCFVYSSSDVPILISASGTPTVNSYLPITDSGIINDLDVLNLTGLHTYVDDLIFTLFAPSAANVLIWNRPCSNHDNFNINFDQSAANSNWPCPPTDGGIYKPSNSLVTFNSQQLSGQWRLQIYDRANNDGGSLQTWKLKTCVNNFCRLKVDNTYSEGAGSLYAAVNCADTGDTIRFNSSIMNDTIDLGNENLVINKHIVIESDLSKNIHIFSSGDGATIQNSAPSTGDGLVIKGVHIHASGLNTGAVENNGKLVLDDVIIHNYPGSSNPSIINNVGSTAEVKGKCEIKDQ